MANPKKSYEEFSASAIQTQQENPGNKIITNLVSELIKGVKNPNEHEYTKKDIKSLNDHIEKMVSKFQNLTNRLEDKQIKSFQKAINNLVTLQDSINEKLKFESFDEPKKRSIGERFSSLFHPKPTLRFNKPNKYEEHPKPRGQK